VKPDTLIVYNLCGLRKDNTKTWLHNIEGFLNDKDSFDFCISACNLKQSTKESFKKYFENKKVKLHFVDDVLPVNITFNFACKINPGYKYYLYCASDVNILSSTKVVTKLKNFHVKNNNAITGGYVLGDTFAPNYNSYKEILKKGENVTFKMGESFNAHFILYDAVLLKHFNALMPDIFRSWCTESVFSFVCASLGKNLGMLNAVDVTLFHPESSNDLDGSSAGFQSHQGPYDLFNSKQGAKERLMSKEAYDVGFGYEECKNLFRHNPEMYKNNKHINPTKLLNFVKKAVYLTKEEFDYTKIKHERCY
jgi:hypothetical protein